MIAIQSDDFNPMAELALPTMLAQLMPESLTPEQKSWAAKLKGWDLRMNALSVEATLFQKWFYKLKHKIFMTQLPEAKNYAPRDIRIVEILIHSQKNPRSKDARHLPDPKKSVTEAYLEAWAELETHSRKPEEWIWRDTVDTHLPHVAHLPGFGSGRLNFNGSAYSVRGNAGDHGAVYRFVVALDPTWPEAWVQIPGGPNGDPLAPDYENFVKDWAAGDMRKVAFYKDLEEARTNGAKIITYSPEAK